MSDNLRRYRAIRRSLTQCYPDEPTGHVARHVTTLAALISGIVASKSTQLPTVASTIPDGNLPESRVKRLTRWLRNDSGHQRGLFSPVCQGFTGSFRLADAGSGHRRQRCGTRLRRPDDACDRPRSSPAALLAGTPRQKGACSCVPAYRPGQAGSSADPRGGPCRPPWRWRMRWRQPSANACTSRLVLWVSHGRQHDGNVARRDLPPCYHRCLSQTGNACRLIRRPLYRGCIRPHSAHLLLGQRLQRAAVFGHQPERRRGGMLVVWKTMSHCNLLLGPEKSRLPSAYIPSFRP